MSTKLYDGLKLVDSAPDIFEIVPLIAAPIREAFSEAARELVAKELAYHIDGLKSSSTETPKGIVYNEVEDRWTERQEKFGSHHALNDPLRFSIVFGRSRRGNILAYPFYREDRYRVVLEATGLFEDYHYQDQSDHPEEISAKKWKARGKEWDSLLNAAGTLGDLPTWELSDSTTPFSEVRYSSYGSDFDANLYLDGRSRLRSVISSQLLDGAVAAENRADPDSPATTEGIMGMLFDARETVSRFFEREESYSRLTPIAPLPTGISFGYDDLPAPYELDPAILAELMEDLRERRAARHR